MAKKLTCALLALLACLFPVSILAQQSPLLQAIDDVRQSAAYIIANTLAQQEKPAPVRTLSPRASGYVSVNRKLLGKFPSSELEPKGKTWDVMHEDGFTGDFNVACKLLKLDEHLCTEWKSAHAEGRGVAMDMPKNGITLDALTYTRKGVHYVQESVRVDLVKFPTLAAMVYELKAKDGTMVHIIRHLGCNNISRVNGWQKPIVAVVQEAHALPLAPAEQGCAPSWLQVNVWDPKALDVPGVLDTIMETRRAAKEDVFVPNRLSRKYGRTLRDMHTSGTLQRGVQVHHIQIILRKVNGNEYQVFKGEVRGMQRMHFPHDFIHEGDTMRIIWNDYGILASPTSTGIHVMQREVKIVCGETFHVHAIDNPA